MTVTVAGIAAAIAKAEATLATVTVTVMFPKYLFQQCAPKENAPWHQSQPSFAQHPSAGLLQNFIFLVVY